MPHSSSIPPPGASCPPIRLLLLLPAQVLQGLVGPGLDARPLVLPRPPMVVAAAATADFSMMPAAQVSGQPMVGFVSPAEAPASSLPFCTL